uniref:BTB domain-containing protein n=1 Tax=Leersia perrieri TaxID=77586 RepID=A0A0D9VF95_9ORYZ
MGGDSRSTASAIVADIANGSHVLRIDGEKKNIGGGHGPCRPPSSSATAPFSVGGYSWAIKYFPNGSQAAKSDYLSIFVVLDSPGAKDVKAQCSFSLLGQDGTLVPSYVKECEVNTFPGKGSDRGLCDFIKKNELEEPEHMRADSFSVRCDLTVLKEIRCEEMKVQKKKFVEVPPSNIHQHLGDLLKNMDGTDVIFEVGEEKFFAHACLLAARSSVFKAELFGAMKANSTMPIKIEDMEPSVFKCLLNFMYTDSLPEACQKCSDVVLAQHLLVAADRYNVERLKRMCEEMLREHIDSSMVATSLALAEQHSCHGVKEACFEFLSSRSNLEGMMASDGFEHLKNSCPFVFLELSMRFLPSDPKQ